ncbi:MAG: PH domain-containing protein, partial [Saprospiraceae bacterium]
METNLHEILRQPQKQSPVAIFSFILRFLKMLIRSTWVIIVFYFIGNRDGSGSYTNMIISITALVVAGGAMIMSVLSYFRYTYFIDDDSLNIHKGVLGRKKVNIPFERIQNINFEQKILHRIFNVVSLEIDTAGSAGSEIKIEALSKEQANLIRDYILEKKRFIQTEIIEEKEIVSEKVELKNTNKLLLRLNIIDLIKIGVSQNHLRTTGIIIGFGFTFFDNIQEALGFDSVQYFIDNLGFVGTSVFPKIIILLIFLLLISFLITLIRTIFQYFDLRFFKTEDGYRLKMGLLTKQEVSLREEKVQLISWAENPIRRLFKIFTLTIKQAAAGVVVNKKQAANIPGCY